MATYYVRGATGSNANTGADWNNAKQTVQGALNLATSTSVTHLILVDNSEIFTANAAIIWTPASGTTVAIYGVTRSGTSGYTYDSATIPTEYVGLSATAAFTINGAANCSMYVKGMAIVGSSGNNAANVIAIFPTLSINSNIEFCECLLSIDNANASTSINFGPVASGSSRGMSIKLVDCRLNIDGSRGGTAYLVGECDLEIVNPTIQFAGGTKPSVMFAVATAADTANVVIRDGTIDYMGSAAVFSTTNMGSSKFLLKNLKFTSSLGYSGIFPGGYGSVIMRDCTYYISDIMFYKFAYFSSYGSVQASTLSVVTDPGAEALYNGERVSWLLGNGAWTGELNPLATPLLEVWNDLVGDRVARIEFGSNDGWTNKDIWMELSYHGIDDEYVCVSTRIANPLMDTPTTYPASSATWSDNPTDPQYMEIPFTAGKAGLVQARVFYTGPGVFVNPVLLLS